MTYWVNVYECGRPGTLWDSLLDAITAAGDARNVTPLYRIKVTLKGKA